MKTFSNYIVCFVVTTVCTACAIEVSGKGNEVSRDATKYTITVAVGGEGQGVVTSDPPGINCPPTCSSTFERYKSVRLSLESSPNSFFNEEASTCPKSVNEEASCNVTFDLAKQWFYAVNSNEPYLVRGALNEDGKLHDLKPMGKGVPESLHHLAVSQDGRYVIALTEYELIAFRIKPDGTMTAFAKRETLRTNRSDRHVLQMVDRSGDPVVYVLGKNNIGDNPHVFGFRIKQDVFEPIGSWDSNNKDTTSLYVEPEEGVVITGGLSTIFTNTATFFKIQSDNSLSMLPLNFSIKGSSEFFSVIKKGKDSVLYVLRSPLGTPTIEVFDSTNKLKQTFNVKEKSPKTLAILPSKSHMYVTHPTSDRISVLAIGADGSLSEEIPPFYDKNDIETLLFPNDKFAYGIGSLSSLYAYTVEGDGRLTFLKKMQYTKKGAGYDLDISAKDMAIGPVPTN